MKKRIAFVGCGNLASIICQQIGLTLPDDYEVCAVYGPPFDFTEQFAQRFHIAHVPSIAALLDLNPDYVVEADSPATCAAVMSEIVKAGVPMIVLSTGAFAQPGLLDQVQCLSRQSGSQVYLASGAIGALDLMQAASLMGPVETTVINRKPPHSLEGAPALGGRALSQTEAAQVFSGSAREAIQFFPQNVNVAVTAALMTAGLDDTRVEIISDPAMVFNSHQIELKGRFGRAMVTIDSAPSPQNPKSSELAAWSVLALLKRLSGPLTF